VEAWKQSLMADIHALEAEVNKFAWVRENWAHPLAIPVEEALEAFDGLVSAHADQAPLRLAAGKNDPPPV